MAHLLTWTQIRLLARPPTIYSRYREGKHHFRWLLRWRNLPVRASPPSSPLLRLTAYLWLASCLSTPGWMCIGIEYRQAALSLILLLFLATASFRSLSLSFSLSQSLSFFLLHAVRHCLLVFEIFCQFLWKLRPDRSNRFSPFRPLSLMLSHSLFFSLLLFSYICPRFSPFLSRALSSVRWVAMP